MIKSIIFDFDDTLAKTLETKIEALQETAKKFYDFNLTSETIKQHWGKPYNEFLNILFLEAEDNLESIIKNYGLICENYPTTTYNDTLETIDALFEEVPLGIVSSAGRSVVYRDMGLINLPPEKFFYIQTAEGTSVHKPNPRVFDPMFKKLALKNIKKEEITYVGDAFNDYLAARDAGIHFYALADRTTPKSEFLKENVIVLQSIKDLLNYL